MARPHSRFQGRPARKIDFKAWDSIPGLVAASTTDETIIAGGLFFTIPATILRWRGFGQVTMDVVGLTAGDRVTVGMGIAIVSQDAFNAGAGSMPDPISEPEFPWIFMHEAQFTAEGAGAPAAWGPLSQRWGVDSKAMRKIKPGEAAVVILQTVGNAGAPGINIDIGQTRVLIGT